MGKKKNKTGEKRPVAVTVIAIGIVVLFFVRIYQSIKPLAEENSLRKIQTEPIFLNGILTPHGQAILESLLYLILAIGLIVVLLGFLQNAPLDLGFPDGLGGIFHGGRPGRLFLFW